MSEILQTMNSEIEDKKDNKSKTLLLDNAIESVKTKKENKDVFESYLTAENGIPWSQTDKEPQSKSEINIQGTENPKFIPEELARKKQSDVEARERLKETIDHQSKMIDVAVNKSKNEADRRAKTIKSMQETIDHQSKMIKEAVNKSKNETDGRAETIKSMQEAINHKSKIIKEATNKSKNEADRRAKTNKSMQETIDHQSKMIKEAVNKSKNKVLDKVHYEFTPEELARKKQADVEAPRRLKETIESKFKIDKPIELETFDPNKDLQKYIDTYKYEPMDNEWDQSMTYAKEDSNFSDELNFISEELNQLYSHHNASYIDKLTTDGEYSRFIEKELILCTA